jgi:dihydrofolate reductase
MKEIIIIVAISKNNVIGKNNKIPWYIKEDFLHFKEITTNHPVIMGKNTFLSLPKKPLPKRTNIVLVFKDDNFNYPETIIKNNLEEAIEYAHTIDDKAYIIGGGFVYKQAMEIATKLEVTLIDKEYEGDVFFPKINSNLWEIIKEEKKDGFSFITYVKT